LLGADDPAPCLVEQSVLGGQHDHWRGLEQLVVLDQSARLIAIQSRHHDVDEDDLRLLVGDLGQRLETIGRRDHVTAFALEQRLGRPADGLGIIDHHDLQPFKAALVTLIEHSSVPLANAALSGRVAIDSLYSKLHAGCQAAFFVTI